MTRVDQALAIRFGGFQEHVLGSNGQVLELADVRCVDFDSVMTGSAMEGSPRILELAVDSGNVVGINSAAPMMVEQFSMGKLPFATGNFAAVVALDLLDRVPWVDVAPLLKEYRRVIHPHGALIVRVQDGNAISYRLLEHSLRDTGFETVNRITRADATRLLGTRECASAMGDYILLSASAMRRPHEWFAALDERAFRERVARSSTRDVTAVSASFVIPVHNEARGLPGFFSFLERVENRVGVQREFIIVLNGCTDGSESLVRQFAKGSFLNCTIVESEIGILQAFRAGVESRKLDGYVGKLDADTILHPHSLDLMHLHLAQHEEVRVTYAEPIPLDARTIYSIPDHDASAMSSRLYFNGKASLYRRNPFEEALLQAMTAHLRAEDIFLSFLYAYKYGLDSVSVAPHAFVYQKTIGTVDDVVRMLSRCSSEITRICDALPAFRPLNAVFDQHVFAPEYRRLLNRVRPRVGYVSDWTRLESTK